MTRRGLVPPDVVDLRVPLERAQDGGDLLFGSGVGGHASDAVAGGGSSGRGAAQGQRYGGCVGLPSPNAYARGFVALDSPRRPVLDRSG